jgi:Mce-associated membrane protein
MARVAVAPAGQLIAAVAHPDDDIDSDAAEPDGRETGGASTGAREAKATDDAGTFGADERIPADRTLGTAARWMIAAALGIVVALAALVGWMSYQSYRSSAAQHQRELFVQVARQSALNLTTIDWQHADEDVGRILDNATGSFKDDFAVQSQSFLDVVKRSKSTTAGTISEAGVESESGDSAQILVAVTVKTSNAVAPQQEPRSWRLRIGVQNSGQDVKVSNVEFVP